MLGRSLPTAAKGAVRTDYGRERDAVDDGVVGDEIDFTVTSGDGPFTGVATVALTNVEDVTAGTADSSTGSVSDWAVGAARC